jgi:hypothetical protein
MPEALDSRTGRPLGDHGTAQDAIDFVLDSSTEFDPGEARLFMEAWREGNAADEWPEFYTWLKDQPQRGTA